MNALPHLLHRLRRWWALACWRNRIAQLDEGIARIEADLAADAAVLSAFKAERRLLAMRLSAADFRHTSNSNTRGTP
ncbi:MAG: hypothetical protein RJA36_1854 [Pseudomonadota bacterium]|jgi:hypothetical protein